MIPEEPPVLQFLGQLKKKRVAPQKIYLSLVLEDVLIHNTLLNTAAEITVMSAELFENLHRATNHANKELKFQSCSLEMKPYSVDESTLPSLTQIKVSIGPMIMVHPVYISDFNTTPLLTGKDSYPCSASDV